jgi:hypothetical protein
VKYPAANTCNATPQLIAVASGRNRCSQLGGYNSADWNPAKYGVPP